ncbi:MAG TPA: hypothetical protein VF405_00845 [Gammaproteobacteria bacterium]
MRINVAVPEAHVSRPVLDAALEATTRLNESLIKSGEVPLFDTVRDHIRWKPEPPGQEHFDHAGIVLGRKWGDCDDMAPYAAASMRATGEDPGATAIVKRSGPQRWHAVVQRSDGTIRDPSRETGMGQTNGVLGSALPFMRLPGTAAVNGIYHPRPQLALRPVRSTLTGEIEAWQARADLPWHWTHDEDPAMAMATIHASDGSSSAVVGACNGLIRLGEANDIDDALLTRAAAIRDACEGCPWEELAGMYGEEDATAAGALVGSFFSNLAKKAAPLLSATPFAPVVATFGGRQVARSMVPQGGGGGGFGPGFRGGSSTSMPIMEMKNFLAQNPQFAPIAKTVLPLAGTAFLGPLGAMGGNMLAQFVTPQQAAFQSASPELQASLQQGMNLPPPGYGGGGGMDPMSLMSMFGGALPFG